MKKNTQENRLCREAFRRQAIKNGVADDCVIDIDEPADMACVAGCYKSIEGEWITYYTDERSKVRDERRYTSPKAAYSDLAKRLGFEFHAPKTLVDAVEVAVY